MNHKTCLNTFGQDLEKPLFAIRPLIANKVFFKTLSRSIYTSFIIKGGGQGVLKRKKLLTPSICDKKCNSDLVPAYEKLNFKYDFKCAL